MQILPVSWATDTDHPQVLVSHGTDFLIQCDKEIASFVGRTAKALPPHARTDFSCQGNASIRIVSGYLVIATAFEWWANSFAGRLAAAIRQSTGYNLRLVRTGHWPDYSHGARRGTRIYIEQDSIGGDEFWRGKLYHDLVHRLTVRWRPQDFQHVEAGLSALLPEMKVPHISADRPE